MKKFISILMMIMVVFTICSCEYNNYYGFDENGELITQNPNESNSSNSSKPENKPVKPTKEKSISFVYSKTNEILEGTLYPNYNMISFKNLPKDIKNKQALISIDSDRAPINTSRKIRFGENDLYLETIDSMPDVNIAGILLEVFEGNDWIITITDLRNSWSLSAYSNENK